jgi:hypothetical protein
MWGHCYGISRIMLLVNTDMKRTLLQKRVQKEAPTKAMQEVARKYTPM